MRLKQLGRAFILCGLVLLLSAAGFAGYNLYLDQAGKAQSDSILDKLAVSMQDVQIKPITSESEAELNYLENGDPQPVELDGRTYLCLVSMPSLGLQLPVQDQWSYDALRVSPCRMSGTVADGDMVIIGHNYRSHFGTLSQLRQGDEVSLTMLDGVTYVYRVDTTEVVEPTDVESVTSGDWPLTLMTCTMGRKTRLLVRCDLLLDK